VLRHRRSSSRGVGLQLERPLTREEADDLLRGTRPQGARVALIHSPSGLEYAEVHIGALNFNDAAQEAASLIQELSGVASIKTYRTKPPIGEVAWKSFSVVLTFLVLAGLFLPFAFAARVIHHKGTPWPLYIAVPLIAVGAVWLFVSVGIAFLVFERLTDHIDEWPPKECQVPSLD
jgi:hypothetical protein